MKISASAADPSDEEQIQPEQQDHPGTLREGRDPRHHHLARCEGWHHSP